jgi:hypothetical protein
LNRAATRGLDFAFLVIELGVDLDAVDASSAQGFVD